MKIAFWDLLFGVWHATRRGGYLTYSGDRELSFWIGGVEFWKRSKEKKSKGLLVENKGIQDGTSFSH